MNLPVGEVISKGVDFREVDAKRLVQSFYDKSFSGYLVVTLEGYDGLEEGMVLFKDGVMAGAYYEYDLHGITVFGDQSVPHVFNSFAAEFVVGDIVSLSNQQVDLVTAFNDKAKIEVPVNKDDVMKLTPKVYSSQFAEGILINVIEKKASKKDVFKKLGLTELGD